MSEGDGSPQATISGGADPADEAYRRHGAEVVAFFRGQRGLRPDEADDLAQETFLRAHRGDRLRGVRNLRAYLLQAARNLFRDRLRRERLAEFVPLEDTSADRVHDRAPSPEAVASAREEMAAVLAALAELPERARQAVLLHKFHQLSYAEVAAVMGISPRTVEKHLARGLAACTAALGPARRGRGDTVVRLAAAAGRIATDGEPGPGR